MPSFRNNFSSKYLKADDVGAKRPIVTIESVRTQQIGAGSDAELKLVVEFTDPAFKTFVLNRTNAEMIAEIAGTEDTDNWPGTKLQLTVTRVEFQGKRVPAIRVVAPPTRSAAVDEAPF